MHFAKNVLVLATVASSAIAGAISHAHGHTHAHLRRVDHDETRSLSKRGLEDRDISSLLKLGITKTGINSQAPTSNVWIGTNGKYTNEFTNESGESLVLVVWGVAGSWVGGLNPVQPLVTASLGPNEKTTLSFADGASGGWAAIYPDTTLNLGQVFNTWGEFTFGPYSTVDVSREVNMNGRNMTIVTPGCVSDMKTCVFVCKNGALSCWLEYELLNCHAGNGGGSDAAAMNGGCNGIPAAGGALKTYLG